MITKEMHNCLRNGCRDGEEDREKCRHCGFDKAEDQRRKSLPLKKDKNGRFHIVVGRKPEGQNE